MNNIVPELFFSHAYVYYPSTLYNKKKTMSGWTTSHINLLHYIIRKKQLVGGQQHLLKIAELSINFS